LFQNLMILFNAFEVIFPQSISNNTQHFMNYFWYLNLTFGVIAIPSLTWLVMETTFGFNMVIFIKWDPSLQLDQIKSYYNKLHPMYKHIKSDPIHTPAGSIFGSQRWKANDLTCVCVKAPLVAIWSTWVSHLSPLTVAQVMSTNARTITLD